MNTHRRARGGALLAAAALSLLGGGCRNFFFREVITADEAALFGDYNDSGQRVLLGLVLDGGEPTGDRGASVLRVLQESPAEKAGVQPGDVVTRFGARRVRANADLVGEVKRRSAGTSAELTVERGGQERRVTVTLGKWQEHDQRLRDWLQTTRYDVSEYATGFYHGEAFQIEPAEWLAWRGQRLRAPYVLYDDDDVLPFAGLFTLFRVETAPAIDAWRCTFLFWPLSFGSDGDGGDDDYLQDLLEVGEESHEVI